MITNLTNHLNLEKHKNMTNRITEKQLQALVDRINIATNSPMEPYIRTDGKFIAQIGNYHLDGAYGGWKLARMCNKNGGESDVFHSGFCAKRELYDQLHAFLRGLEAQVKITEQV